MADTSKRASGSPARRNWQTEYAELRDRQAGLDPAILERLGIAAYLSGHEAESIDIFTRAHTLALQGDDTRQAARCAFWVSFALIGARELTRAAGWGARARRLLEHGGHDCVECGLAMLPHALEQIASGDLAGAEDTLAAAEGIGERFGDPDLTSLARQGRGRVLVGLGRAAEGVALFDEAMVSVTAGEVSPIVAGVVYCSVIGACVEMIDVRRAHEWTEALNDWCALQPGLVPYRGECLTHRAEICCLRGRWREAYAQAQLAYDALVRAKHGGEGMAAYALAELHRLQGARDAEEAYRRASDHGRSPHPGLALLRLAQGQLDAARAGIERAIAEPSRGRQRAEVLAAAVDVFLASADLASARRAADELNAMTARLNSDALRAMAASANGAVRLAEGDAPEALRRLRDALTIWRDLEMPYEAARVQVLVGRACLALGDADGARMEWGTAARAFQEFGAAPALAQVEALLESAPPAKADRTDGLTAREVEVLRLIARGETNRAIARELGISDKTVARHVSNIFSKLDLSTRAAAAAYAFRHRLVPST